jgi:peptide/bleomycin uptake transporter
MLGEFFCGAPRTSAVAWGGLAVVVGYSFFVARVKAQLNGFYETFYDLLGEGGGTELGSGDLGSGAFAQDGAALADQRARVYNQLCVFALIIAPLVSASPACKYVRSAWAFHWRMALMKAYLAAWDTKQEPIEGASQRLHEDTQRFADGLDGCLVTLLDAVFTLVLFTPILVDLSGDVAPPFDFGALDGSWLWTMAFFSSLIGLTGAAVFGQKLVGLEVSNQRVEALLRKDLVLLETTPAVIVGTETPTAEAPSARTPVRVQAFLPQTYFLQTLRSLKINYFALFKHFGMLNFWLSLFDQCMVILPYLLVAPRIFSADPARRITLGTLIKVSNCFGHVFGSLSVIAENWGAINEFRSTLRRLREFEGKLYAEARGTNRLLTETAMQHTEMASPPAAAGDGPTPPAPEPPAPSPNSSASSDAPYPIVNGINPASEVPEEAPSRRGRCGPRAARAEGLPIEIHVERPPDFESMRV